MKEVNYIDFTKKNTHYFTNNNQAIDVKKEKFICTSIYLFKEYLGDGNFTRIESDDFSIDIIDIKPRKNLIIKTQSINDFLEFSHLLSGQQIIETNTKHGTIIYQADQSYLAYLNNYVATYHFSRFKHFKEIRIRISQKMMDLLDINQNDYNIHTIENTFIKKTGENTIKQLISLIENNFKDLSKTLFMKGKIAEILAGYLAIDNTKTPFCAIIDSVKKSKQIIKKNIDKQLTSKCIAEEIHINETELKQNFKNITGLSIQKFGIKLKMEKAKKLLKLTEMPIYQIAEETGYKNATHFTNAFKKNTNILPKKFRTDFNLK